MIVELVLNRDSITSLHGVADLLSTVCSAGKSLSTILRSIDCAAPAATMAVQAGNPLKRSSTAAQFDTPAPKKQNNNVVHHHKASWDPQRAQRWDGTWQNEVSQQHLLTRSIGLALQAVGFKAAALEAIDAFRGDVEECMSRSTSLRLNASKYTDATRHDPFLSRCAPVYVL